MTLGAFFLFVYRILVTEGVTRSRRLSHGSKHESREVTPAIVATCQAPDCPYTARTQDSRISELSGRYSLRAVASPDKPVRWDRDQYTPSSVTLTNLKMFLTSGSSPANPPILVVAVCDCRYNLKTNALDSSISREGRFQYFAEHPSRLLRRK
jgi:hypothetical protein